MSNNWQSDVDDFLRVFGLKSYSKPTPDAKLDLSGKSIPLRVLCRKLIVQESSELCDALDVNDLPKIADGAIDLIYVAIYAMSAYGIQAQPVWDLVHEANMRKNGGGFDADGKIMKPDDWKHPDIAAEIRRQQEQ